MINEDFRNYEQESKWLNMPYNKTVIYIPDKCITLNEDGEYYFYYIVEIGQFVYGLGMDDEFLHPVHALDKDETQVFATINSINRMFHIIGLTAVYLRRENGIQYIVFCHEDHPETFFKIKYDDHTKITMTISKILLAHNTENSIEQPFKIEFQNSMFSLCDKTYFYV